jgi:hypothetical protein
MSEQFSVALQWCEEADGKVSRGEHIVLMKPWTQAQQLNTECVSQLRE